jgi:nucleoside 2-deoxyribosyltransferase
LGTDFEVKRADDYNKAGNITSQVIQAIANADLIVADLTDRNANVYYELGVAHSYKKHVVPMISGDDPQDIPFDNYAERAIRYSLKTVELRNAAKGRLSAMVQETLNEPVSNPVTTALGLEKAAASGDSTEQLIKTLVDRVVDLTGRMDKHERQLQAMELASLEPTSIRELLALDPKIFADLLARSPAWRTTTRPKNALAYLSDPTSTWDRPASMDKGRPPWRDEEAEKPSDPGPPSKDDTGPAATSRGFED